METPQEKMYADGNFSSRLAKLIAESASSQKDISIQTDISPSALAKYKVDRTPKSDELLRLATFFNVSMEWLLTGATSAPKADEEAGTNEPYKVQDEESDYQIKQHGGRMVPVIGMAHAGVATDYDEIEMADAQKVPTMCTDPKAFALDIEGDSMFPLIQDRDNVVVMPSKEPHNGCVVVARLKDGGVVCRKVERVGLKIKLIPVNEKYDMTDHEPNDFYWIYPVFGAWTQIWR